MCELGQEESVRRKSDTAFINADRETESTLNAFIASREIGETDAASLLSTNTIAGGAGFAGEQSTKKDRFVRKESSAGDAGFAECDLDKIGWGVAGV